MRSLIGVVLLMAATLSGCALFPGREPITLDRSAIDELIASIVAGHGEPIEISVWIGGAEGGPWYALNENEWHAGASAVKTAYLIELFAAHAGELDEPLEGTSAIVGDPTHPAVIHFDEETQTEIRENIEGATVRRVGEMMIHGTGVSNPVYNAAANVTTAVLGGPEGITQRIRARAPEFEGIAIRRYMLADRNVTGDNEATAATLAAVLQRVARADLEGVDEETIEAMRDVLYTGREWGLGRHHFKSGSLNTDPLVRLRTGYYLRRGRVIVYVVIAQQATPIGYDRNETYERLGTVTQEISDVVLGRAKREVHGALAFLPW